MQRDPDQPLPGAPDPWAGSEMPARRDGPPYHMTEMIEAEPGLAARLLPRLAEPDGAAARLAAAVRASAERGQPIVVTGCGTSEHGALAIVEILREALRTAGLPWRLGHAGCPVAVQAFEGSLEDWLGVAGGLVIGVSHEGGTWATNRALEQARASGATVALHHRLGSLARRGPRRHRRHDRRAGPELVPHRRLRCADPRRGRGRGSPVRRRRSTRPRRAPCSRPASRPPPSSRPSAWPPRSRASSG